MNDFQFHNTTKVYFGKDQLGHLHEEVLKYGKSVLVVYGGGSIKKIGLYDKVKKELKDNNIEVYELAVEEPENYSARATMLWAASWALNSFCTSGYKTQAQLHALEQFSSTYDMTHGLALAIITPKWMTYLLNKDETVARDFARFGLNVMGIQDQGNDMANAKAGIKALQNFIKDELHLPTTLSEMNITDEKFDELKVKACYGQDSLPRAYRPLSQEDCLNIYKMCL